jgi:transglutaminase-like putative cysteine protease
MMQLRVGFEMTYQLAQPTPMLLALSIHPSRAADLVQPDQLETDPAVATASYLDLFGNRCSRLVAPPGRFVLRSDARVNDSGEPDIAAPCAVQTAVEDLPSSTLLYLLGSRYCETELLSDIAWRLFGAVPAGWARVQAICDHVHRHIEFGYPHARATRTAMEAHTEARGVCRDYAHLAITLCRCMDIPARYCTGYLGDVGTEPPYGPMDFAAWFEAYLGDRWYTFDARNNTPRIGRVLIARGRDACDVALSTTFGPNQLLGFRVWTDVVQAA